ncbi:MAG: hypothetical protein J6B95_04685 [Oscillospiraceae bacterium]|nr:hypothetical protein [Oscillospiraceae bacterium]
MKALGGDLMPDVALLFYKYRDDVYRLAVSYTRSQEEAEDGNIPTMTET